jgi:glyoxylase-like metal-dependent hydrolase (beta-lactamase superfamily II)
LSASDFKDRAVNEINFSDYDASSFVEIGGYRAHDFFGDGSFYLLDTPGHCIGHMCGLARVTGSKSPLGSTFVFMGGDIAHFAGVFRPSEAIPLPDPIPEGVLDEAPQFSIPCEAWYFTDQHPRFVSNVPDNNRRDDGQQGSWYKVSTHERSGYTEPDTAQESVDKMQAFDDSPDVLVCTAHDPTLLDYLPTLNKEGVNGNGLKDFKEKGWKEKCHWGWLNELPRDGKPGRPPIVEGFWRDGKQWDRGEDGKGAGQTQTLAEAAIAAGTAAVDAAKGLFTK